MKKLKDTANLLVSLIDLMHEAGIQNVTGQAINISPGTIQVVRCVRQNPGAGVMDIANWTGLAKPTVSLLVKDMVAKGILRRETQQEDARRICLYITDEGDQMNSFIQEYRCQKAEKLLSSLGKEEIVTMGKLMLKILNNRRKA